MENLYKKTYESKRRNNKNTEQVSTPPPKSVGLKEKPHSGSSSAPPKMKVKAKTSKETEMIPEVQEQETSKGTPSKVPKPMKQKPEKLIPKKRSRKSSDFGSGKALKKFSTSDANKGKAKVVGISTADPAQDSDSSSESEKPRKKLRHSEVAMIQVPESVAKYFSDDEAAASFVKNFTGRQVSPLKYLSVSDLLQSNLHCIRDLIVQGLRSFLEFKYTVYPELVKVFYCNLSVKKGMIKSKVKGVKIKISFESFLALFHVQSSGKETSDNSEAFNGYDRFEYYLSLCKPETRESIRNNKSFRTGPLTAENRLLHYFITYLIAPRGCNHAMVMDSDLYLMFAIQHKIQLNWAEVLTNHMRKSRHLQYLPFGFHVSYILFVSGVDTTGETAVPPRTIALIDSVSLGKLDMGWNLESKTFDYMSDHTVKVSRQSKSRPSSSTPRSRSDSNQILEAKIDALHKFVEETRQELLEKQNRLEALILMLIPENQRPSVQEEEAQQDKPKESVPTAARNDSQSEEGTEPLLTEAENEGGTELLLTEEEPEQEAPIVAEPEPAKETLSEPNVLIPVQVADSDSSTESDDTYRLVRKASKDKVQQEDESTAIVSSVVADIAQHSPASDPHD